MDTSKEPGKAALCRMTEDEARAFIESIRWPEGPVCPHCGSSKCTRLQGKATRPGVLKCNEKGCRKQFTVTVGTIFQGSHIQLRDWVYAFARICASKKGVSALQLQRELNLQYRSAWFLAHRVRWAMRQEPLRGMLRGIVECDETYVGGKRREPVALWKRNLAKQKGRPIPWSQKIPVVALVERSGRVHSRAVTDVAAPRLKASIRELVHPSATIMTDEARQYRGLAKEFEGGHKTVNHSAGEYYRHADGAGINEAESYFALLKRGIYGVFHNVSKQHLQRYCDEFDFRWNHREVTDRERTIAAIRQAPGKRLSYSGPVTGKAAT
jgi:transposase-like protein